MSFELKQRYPSLFLYPQLGKWLTTQYHLGLAPATLEAYARALLDYTAFCQTNQIDLIVAQREHIAAYMHDMASRVIIREGIRHGLANATMHQRLVAVRLCYDYLVEEKLRDNNPVKKGPIQWVKGSQEPGVARTCR